MGGAVALGAAAGLGTFKPGDQIEAKLSTDGKVVAIKPADAR